MSDLWKRIEQCREDARAYEVQSHDPRWRRVQEELARVAEAGRQHEAGRDVLLEEVALVLSCTQPSRVLEMIMDAVIRLSHAEQGFLLLQRSPDAQQIAAARNMERARVERPADEISSRVVAETLQTGQPVCIADALNTPPYSLADSVQRLKIASVLCVPIRADERILGVIYLENRQAAGVFSEDAKLLVARFAQRIGPAILNAEALDDLRRNRDQLQAAFAKTCAFEGIVGHSPKFRAALQTIAVAAASELPILIEGESGTGKDLIARAVHLKSPRCDAPFVAVNCAALPHTLLESELFGHVRGAFTGATSDRPGLFASARNGTLFLDEIGEMPSALQAKLLRVLQSGEYRAVGSDQTEAADVRIVAATVRDLAGDVQTGDFRRDLFFRLKGVYVHLPPLRERREDIPLLITHFLDKFAPANDALNPDPAALGSLLTYDYPGNVRELATIIQRAVLFARDGVIGPDALPPEVADAGGAILRLPVPMPATAVELLAAKKRARLAAVDELERAFLLRALAAADGHPTEAARQTGMNRSQFARMLAKHKLTASMPGRQERQQPESS